ncbi:cyclin-dependent kinase 2-associated protein 1-like [Panonychus citri]|uniref:cyclin-dependent kinase 2-associated protein 1-like n=1 Tax=Panonychus citri TaxID=50023 RepID=UPI002306E9A9|nr:cyclin-dependent kinase 2-associated protein 1-like [Panonychus citri]
MDQFNLNFNVNPSNSNSNNNNNPPIHPNFVPSEMNQVLAAQYQQNFLTGGPPTLVVSQSNIPLYPGYQTIGTNNHNINGNGGNQTSKYNQLLAVIEEMSRDVRPIYSGSKTSTDRFKRGMIHAKVLIRECILELERNHNNRG